MCRRAALERLYNNNKVTTRGGRNRKHLVIIVISANIDAAFFMAKNWVGIGICIQDDQGCFFLVKTEWISPILSVDKGKAIGLVYVIRWVKELYLNNVAFKLDSKRVVGSYHSICRDEFDFGATSRECRSSFSSYFTNSKVEFFRR